MDTKEQHDLAEAVLEEARESLTPVKDLYRSAILSGNYEWPNHYTLFLDLIGYSELNYGQTLYDGPQLGAVELSEMAQAIECYTDRPSDTYELIDTLDRCP